MAKRSLSPAQIKAGFGGKTAKSKRRAPRKMNGAPIRRKRRKMNGARMDIAKKGGSLLQNGLGILGGGLLIGMAEKLAPNYYVRCLGAAVVGVAVGRFMPQLEKVGDGIALAGVAGAGAQALSDAGILPLGMRVEAPALRMNAAKRLTTAQMQALADRIKDAAPRAVRGRQPNTLVGRVPGALVGDWSNSLS
jgi:hypothetical protein